MCVLMPLLSVAGRCVNDQFKSFLAFQDDGYDRGNGNASLNHQRLVGVACVKGDEGLMLLQ